MKRLTIKNILFPLLFWALIYLLFFIAVLQFENLTFALKIASMIVLPVVIPVQLNYYLFEKFFLKRKLYAYFILALINLVGFGVIIKIIQKYIYPDDNTEIFMTIFFFMLLYIGIKYLIQGTKQQFRLKELEAKQAQAELNMLKSQVNPHFLFNSLNSIYSLILKQSDESGPAVLLLSDLMRYILESSKKKKVPLHEELSFITNYIELEKLRLGNNFRLDFDLKGEQSNLFIAPMVLIPFVENIFKHGVSAQNENDFKISIEINDGILNFMSSNRIVETHNNLEEKKNKTGIDNVKKRLSLIYHKNHHLEITQKDSKFQVKLELTLNYDA